MEDVATAEISRSQIWQWIRYNVKTQEGKLINKESVENVIADFMDQIERFPDDRFEDAVQIFREISLKQEIFVDFLTVDAYNKYM
jgi:malate synthase